MEGQDLKIFHKTPEGLAFFEHTLENARKPLVFFVNAKIQVKTSIYYFFFKKYLFLFIYFFIYSYVHIMFWSFLPLLPAPFLSPLPSRFQAETVLPLSLILLKREYKQ
jgi:hypothetical protein